MSIVSQTWKVVFTYTVLDKEIQKTIKQTWSESKMKKVHLLLYRTPGKNEPPPHCFSAFEHFVPNHRVLFISSMFWSSSLGFSMSLRIWRKISTWPVKFGLLFISILDMGFLHNYAKIGSTEGICCISHRFALRLFFLQCTQ